ncbi:MAG: arsenic efflux protein [Acutalibacter sp.]|nr:arsenic efflux protein [Acutalibacter sp.]
MPQIILDAVIDTVKALPFLFGAYLLIEYLERRANDKFARILSGPLGPIGGAVLGCVPQCGFSVAAANFYAGRLISPGALIAVFLATSDEAVPLLLAEPQAFPNLFLLLGVKLISAALFGLLVDLVCKKVFKLAQEKPFQELCAGCHCEEEGIFRAALHHTGEVALVLFFVSLFLGLIIYFVGEENIALFLLSGNVFQPFLTALIGFIPNCAASVILTRLFLGGTLPFGSTVAGLCTGAGLGLIVLFRTNRRLKENFLLVGALYVGAVLTGLLCNLFF